MRPTITQLRTWHTSMLADAAKCAESAAMTLDTSMDTVERAMDDATFWRGKTHSAADLRVREERDHADEVRNVLHQFADEASDAATDIGHARTYVLREVDAATAAGFRVSESGGVSQGGSTSFTGDGTPSELDEYQRRISAGLDSIDDFDELYGARLEALSSDLATMIHGQPDVRLPGIGTLDADAAIARLKAMTPDARRNAISAMNPTDRRRLAQADPEVVGNLDGVPFDLRITANEVNIRNALIGEIQAGRPDGQRARTLRDMLRQARNPHESHAPGTDLSSERRFIAFANTPGGRVIEMVGQLRPGVGNAAVYVPGTGTNIDGAQDNRRAAQALAARTGGPVFLFMNGDLPQTLPEAVDPRFAASLAPRLVAFGHDLEAELAIHSPGASTTYVGHSYGGSVVGTADQLGLPADRIIFASSAGTGILDHPWRTPDPAVDRYSLTFPGDPIHLVQSLPGNPHGDDPDTAEGVTRLDTGTYTDRDGVTRDSGVDAHGDYWNDPDSTAFENIVKVITGQPPDLYEARKPDIWVELPAPPGPLGPGSARMRELLEDLADGDIDAPGPLPDIPLRLRLP